MLVLCFACISFSLKAPIVAMIWSDDGFEPSEISEIKKYFKEVINYAKKACDSLTGDDKSKCIAILDGFRYVYPTQKEDINTEISKIENDVDFVYIVSGDLEKTVDLTKLKRQVMVMFLSKREIDSKLLDQKGKYEAIKQQILTIKDHLLNNNLQLSAETMTQLSHSLSSKSTIKKPKSYDYNLYIKGGIKSKVSFLTIVKYNVKIFTEDLNCHSVYMKESTIDPTGKKITTDFFLADDETHCELFGCSGDYSYEEYRDLYQMVEPKQYAFVRFDLNDYKYDYYQIIHNEDYWELRVDDCYGNVNDCYRLQSQISYNFCDVFSVISNYLYMEMKYNEDIPDDIILKPLNLTIIGNGLSDGLPFVFQQAETFEIFIPYGWMYKLKLILTYDKSKYNVDKSAIPPELIMVSDEDLYKYTPSSGDGGGSSDDGSSGKNKNKAGMIAGIVVGVVVVIAIIIVVVIVVIKKKRDAANQNSEQENEAE